MLHAALSSRHTLNQSWLQGSIDQVEGIIRFDAHSEELLHWDDQIQSICNQLNGILDSCASRGIPVQ